ncbi:MAG: CinA family nicotinamide mononucleotide deamidase-related protein [Chloroflexota bacterium]|nr:CinA family nicotinamide mononucleotide deamidase-related protein [Chloroflexota bacterium]
MQAEIITTGTELLLGTIVDTNAAYLSQQLSKIGLDLHFRTTVGDNVQRIAMVLRQALSRCDVVIITGGLGPTVDDVTREAVAEATRRHLTFKEDLWTHIRGLFERWGTTAKENNRRQAFVPQGSIVVENPVGTAPAFIVETPQGIVISLPGVPHELKYLTENSVLPYLKDRLQTGEVIIKSKTLHTCSIGESTIDDLIGDLMTSPNPTVGLSAHPGQTDVRITAKAASEELADALIAEMEQRIGERLGDVIYGIDDETAEEVVARMLAERGLRIAIVETNTAGMIARRLGDSPQGRQVLAASAVVQDTTEAREKFGLSADQVKNGLAHPKVASLIAQRARLTWDADLGLAVTGNTEQTKTQYTVTTEASFAALSSSGGTVHHRLRYGGTSEISRQRIYMSALDLVRKHLFEQ